MKSALCLVGLSWLLSASASAQQQPTCPTLPPTAGLQWNQQAGSDYLVCKATTIADGRQVIGMMFTTRDPNIALSRDRRAEKGAIGPESMYWYRLDLGGNTLPEMESRRITVVELGKHRYAQIWIDASSGSELTSVQSLIQSLDLEPASLAISR